MKGSRGKNRIEGMAPTAWLAHLMHATATRRRLQKDSVQTFVSNEDCYVFKGMLLSAGGCRENKRIER